MTTETLTAECRIYVACLASYNNGVLHGAWIDVDGKDADELQEEINAILRSSPYPNVTVEHEGKRVPSAEEWAIHDHEGFADLIEEYTSMQDIAALAEALNNGETSRFAVHWLIKDIGLSIADACEKAEDVSIYQSEAWDLAADYCEEMAEDCYSKELEGLPSFIRHAIDWKVAARDLKLGGDIAESEAFGERFLVTNASEF